VQGNTHKKRIFILSILFFLTWSAPGAWTVCFSNVLRAHGLEGLISYAFSLNALAVFVAPLFIGSLADHSVAPTRLLRWTNWGSGLFLTLTFLSIDKGWGGTCVLLFMLAYSLCVSPNFSLLTSIALNQVENPSKDFGPLRTWGTIGWAMAGWIVSWILQADSSTLSGYTAAGIMTGIGLLTYLLPEEIPATAGQHRTWKEIMGLDALKLFHHHDHCVVFITTALFSIPLAAFFPYAPLHLKELGSAHPAATMSIGQISEIICLLAMAGVLARVRLKWIFLAGIFFGVLRFAFFAIDSQAWVIAGIALHGLCYTLFFITGQIYLAERIDKSMQTRAQALLNLMTSGVGNLLGYLATGWWRQGCMNGSQTHWSLYWGGLSLCIALVGIGFFFTYHGVNKRIFRA
jgi:MFS family permease